ncbi:MAG: helix-hairpin-helix domain-containing protein, partial [Bacteroidales bacterium]|nr:helix-hairpin-helix domain-containing protein [Bacteroidales bacterium]
YPEVLLRLQSLLKVDTAQIRKINANKASLERLKSHPYLSFYQARAIVELRKARSGIRQVNELAEFKEFTKEDIERLKWYLVF